jgi:tetratricopeptide (TPR) repeat protein
MSSVHARAKDIFLDAVAMSAAERPAFVDRACAGDPALRKEVESLLQYHDDDASTDEVEPRAIGAEFAPGAVFAGRYRMIARIGQGGMGDVWRADDLVLDTAVALKMIVAAGADARERLLNEVRLARQITHPSVCRVFDVGEADHVVFFSMELVSGEDLAALLRRVGRLPSDKVIDIARQLCAGLSAAHAQGVLHRDLKPANVLIDDDGCVRITDFGIAITTSSGGTHALTGTPAYMAPEQRTPGSVVTERTDVYSLGLVLYELLVGHEASMQSAVLDEPTRPSAIVPNVNPQLERVLMQALSRDPHRRWPSVEEMGAALPHAAATAQSRAASAAAPFGVTRRPFWLVAAGMAALVVLLAYGSAFVRTSGAKTLTERDVVLLADFENTTGDPVFDGALKVALAVALEQSPFLKVFPEEQARQTLRLMQQPPDERITRSIARDIAQRERLKALLAGSIASLGRTYVVTLEAINAQTGDVMAREQAQAASKEQVLSSMGTAASSLRRKLGESLTSVQKFDVPLPRATTTSLDALNAYALALYNGREVPRLEAIPHLKRAIELDPTFAMAYALLSEVYANTGQSALAPGFAHIAFELRDKVSDREQFFISWRYYRDALQAWDKALDVARTWTATYPREAFAFNSLGNALIRFGQFEQAVPALREAIRLDSQFIPAYSNLAASLLALNRMPEARATLRHAADRRLEFAGARRLSYLMAFVEGDAQTMEHELAASVGVRATNAAFGWQAHALAFGGRIKEAHEQFRRGIDRSAEGNFKEVAAQLSMEDAEMHATVGQCDTARAEIPAGLELSRATAALERAGRVFALCGAADALTLSGEVATRLPEAILMTRVSSPLTSALLALSHGESRRVLELLEPVRPYDRAPSAELWPVYVRGLAYLQLKDGAAARKEFQTIVDHRGQVPVSLLYPLAHLGLARAATMTNDPAAAQTSYADMLGMWKAADANLAPLNDARREQASLREPGSTR